MHFNSRWVKKVFKPLASQNASLLLCQAQWLKSRPSYPVPVPDSDSRMCVQQDCQSEPEQERKAQTSPAGSLVNIDSTHRVNCKKQMKCLKTAMALPSQPVSSSHRSNTVLSILREGCCCFFIYHDLPALRNMKSLTELKRILAPLVPFISYLLTQKDYPKLSQWLQSDTMRLRSTGQASQKERRHTFPHSKENTHMR